MLIAMWLATDECFSALNGQSIVIDHNNKAFHHRKASLNGHHLDVPTFTNFNSFTTFCKTIFAIV